MENQSIANPTDISSTNPIAANQSPISPQTKANLMPVLATLLISALLFGFGGYYFGKQSSTNQKVVENIQTSPILVSTSNEPSDQTSPSPTVNSKVLTYLDEDYQFSFQYPKEWKLNCTKPQDDNWLDRNICDITAPETSLDHGQLDSGAYFVIGASKPNPNYSNFQEYIKYSVDQHGYKATLKTVNNIQGYELTSPTNSVFVFERKGNFISVGGIPLETTKPYYLDIQDIISSFKINNR